MSMADLKPSLQMAHLRQAVPEEAKKLLYQEQISMVDRAFEVLTELFEPQRLVNPHGRNPKDQPAAKRTFEGLGRTY